MATAIHHAMSSARKWGGPPELYLPIHEYFDSTKAHMPDFRHRAVFHHGLGISHVVRVFGQSLTTPTGRIVPTQWVAEQHVMEDFGRIPTLADFLRNLQAESWMCRGARKLSKEFEVVSG